MKLLKYIYNTAALFILVTSGIVLFFHFANPDKFRALIVTSGSMEPAVKTGSVVFTVKTENYLPGDIVSFTIGEDSKNLITHRIIHKIYDTGLNPTYLTSGDANEDLDTWTLTDKNIKGKVIFTVPHIGYVANFAKEPTGFILFVIVPATIVVYEELKLLISESINQLKKTIKNLKQKTLRLRSGQALRLLRFHSGQVRSGQAINLLPQKNNFVLPKAAIAIPIFGAAIVFVSITGSFFSDWEKSLGNIFSAATSFEPDQLDLASTFLEIATPTSTPSPSPTPTEPPIESPAAAPTETPTPTPSATPTEQPSETALP